MGAEAVTSGPERGDGFPDATQPISHPSLIALGSPGKHLIVEPLQREGTRLWVCTHASPTNRGSGVWQCEPPSEQGDTQLGGTAIGEVPTVTGCFAIPLCTGLALRLQRSQTIYIGLCGGSWWEKQPAGDQEVGGMGCEPGVPALHMPYQTKQSLRWISWDNLEARELLVPQYLRCHFNLELSQMQTRTLGGNGELRTAQFCLSEVPRLQRTQPEVPVSRVAERLLS